MGVWLGLAQENRDSLPTELLQDIKGVSCISAIIPMEQVKTYRPTTGPSNGNHDQCFLHQSELLSNQEEIYVMLKEFGFPKKFAVAGLIGTIDLDVERRYYKSEQTDIIIRSSVVTVPDAVGTVDAVVRREQVFKGYYCREHFMRGQQHPKLSGNQ